ncbi:AMP-binding protein [Kordiimonas sp.]|uniref:AMP-binding protein n=1 Tax=Kordiimonas sp. TaxID=1970157 RepID=UPI003A8F66E7
MIKQLDLGSIPYRSIDLPAVDISRVERPDGTLILENNIALPPFDPLLYGHLKRQASAQPTKTALAERNRETGEWRCLSFAEMFAYVCSAAQGLLNLGGGPDRPLMILSGNSIAHALMRFGAIVAGVPVCPVSENYALMPGSHDRLKHVYQLVKPGILFAEGGAPFNAALLSLGLDGQTVISADPDGLPVPGLKLETLLNTVPAPDLETHILSRDPDQHAAYMLTSGSTGRPKAVVHSQRMVLTSLFQAYAVLGEAMGWQDRLLDWLPWSHVSGATNLTGATVFGGSFYVDDGKPAPGLFEKTLRNLKDLSVPYFANVPFGYAMLVDALEADADLRRAFFKNLHLMLYGGAGLPQATYERLQSMAVEEVGARIFITTGYGATETTSGCMAIFFDSHMVGVGLPLPGLTVKLVPAGDAFEVRMKGDNVMSGYLDDPAQTSKSFDEEGFYQLGDKLNFHEPDNIAAGLYFAGRLAEEFKLGTGSWVSGGRVRGGLIAALSPLVSDLILCGEGRDELAVLAVPNALGLAGLAGGEVAGNPLENIAIRRAMSGKLQSWNAANPGKSTRIGRFAFLEKPLSADCHEVSDKGTINQAAAIRNRAEEVEQLYADSPGEFVLACD